MEARLRHTMTEMSGWLDRTDLGTILVRIAKSSCSIFLAEGAIKLGADLDFPQDAVRSRGKMTALQSAAKKVTKEAALFMEFLIRKGAQVYPPELRETEGARNIGKFIGMEWDELIEEYHPYLGKRKTGN